MSIFSKFFIKKQPNTLHESETVTKAKELVNRYENLTYKINTTQNIIKLLKYALHDKEDNVVLRITTYEPRNIRTTYDEFYPIDHILYLDESTKETLVKNMLSDYTKQLNDYEKEYKNL